MTENTLPDKDAIADDIINKINKAIDSGMYTEPTGEKKEKPDPNTCKYQVAFTIQAPDKDEPFSDVVGLNTNHEVVNLIQYLNMQKVSTAVVTYKITDNDGKEYVPADFGIAKESTLTNPLSRKIEKVIDNPSKRTFENLLAYVASKRFTIWDIQDALQQNYPNDYEDPACIPESPVSDEEHEKRMKELDEKRKDTSYEDFAKIFNSLAD